MRSWIVGLAVLVVMTLAAGTAEAQVTIDWITVGDPGNVGEWSGQSYGGAGPDRICGAVGYSYSIAKYEVTNAQYTEFLNAKLPDISDAETGTVLPNDTYGLYNRSMETVDQGGINYDPSAASGSKFSVKSGRAINPATYVSWYDTVRFANWITNGQGSGDTESGGYAITAGGQNFGTVTVPSAAQRVTWASGSSIYVLLTSEDEWYKAAYYKGGGTNAGYWDYPTQSGTAPTAVAPPGGSNSANYDYAVGGHHISDVGAYTASDSAYGTFDQGGNLWEWDEAAIFSSRGLRGGGWGGSSGYLHASYRNYGPPTREGPDIGFRVAGVPEPGSVTLLLCGLVAGLIWWRRRR
jgi:formylglycine-generating enzyme required for sulfatase activity